MTHEIREETAGALRSYLKHFPEEQARFDILTAQLASGENLFVRSNMSGHVTSSVVVLNHSGTHVLLIAHKFLQQWLPPGGHYEPPGGIWDTGQREVEEETGVTNLTLHPWCRAHGVPLDIDTHAMPANPKKNEGAHFHHDFRYLAVATGNTQLVAQEAEVDGVRWAPLEELLSMQDRRLHVLTAKLRAIGLMAEA